MKARRASPSGLLGPAFFWIVVACADHACSQEAEASPLTGREVVTLESWGTGGAWSHWIPLVEPLESCLNAEWSTEAIQAGYPALLTAILMADTERFQQWLQNGAWLEERSAGGDTATAAALRWSQPGFLRALCWAGATLQPSGLEGQPLLILAALRRQTEGMDVLLDFGADPNGRTQHPVAAHLVEEQLIRDLKWHLEKDRHLTPLMICAARGDAAGVERLMAAGASQSFYTPVNKRYALQFASMQGYTYIMQLLLGRRPGEEAEQWVVVRLSAQQAELYRDGAVIDTARVSTGRKGYATPAGRFVITNKHRSWTSTLYHVAMPWFMRLNCGAIGLHAGNIPGYPASHGCIRLPYAKAKAFFGQLRVGDLVEVQP